MAKIRSLGNRELQQVLSLLARFSADEFNYPVLERFQSLYLPFHKLNVLLPVPLKFLPGIYVATEKQTVLGLVWLNRDGYCSDRWKIDQVIIDPDATAAYDVGKQLVQYAIHKFGALGVETFLAYVDLHYADGLSLLKDCGFRHGTKVHTYQLKLQTGEKHVVKTDLAYLREARRRDATLLQELHSETLSPEVRISLRTSPADLMPPLDARIRQILKGEFYKRWVIAPPGHRYLCASVAISTTDYKAFDLSLLVSPGWDHITEDLLAFALQQIRKCTLNAVITIQAYEFQKNKMEKLEAAGYERVSTTEILVKDYWIPLDDNAVASKNPVLLFAKPRRTSPA